MDDQEELAPGEPDVLVKRPPIITVLGGLQFLAFIFLLLWIIDPATLQEMEQSGLPKQVALIHFVLGLGMFVGASGVWTLKRWGAWLFCAFALANLGFALYLNAFALRLHIDDLAFGVVCWHYYRGLR